MNFRLKKINPNFQLIVNKKRVVDHLPLLLFFFFCNLWRNSEEETKQLNGESFFYYLDYLPKARAQNWKPPKAYELSVPNCCNVVRRDRKNPKDYRWIWAFGGKWRQLYWADFLQAQYTFAIGWEGVWIKINLGAK